MGKRKRGTAAGQYALIGGKPDPGETAEQAVIREVKEEIGVDFTPVFYLEKIDAASDPENPWLVTYFTGRIKGEINPEPAEIEKVVFVSEKDLDIFNIAFDHRERLEEFFRSRLIQTKNA